ncbi:hypothetical protein ACH3VS_41200 [Streptomyces sp. WSLK1-3]|uniref:hypothetical protein n=1 Tax=Streptomyces sp. WSLK1-3 TaxID=3375475 RepID=UPI003788F4AC
MTAALLDSLSLPGTLGACMLGIWLLLPGGIPTLLPDGIPALIDARSRHSVTRTAVRLAAGTDPQERQAGLDILRALHGPPGTDAQTASEAQEPPPDSSPASPP